MTNFTRHSVQMPFFPRVESAKSIKITNNNAHEDYFRNNFVSEGSVPGQRNASFFSPPRLNCVVSGVVAWLRRPQSAPQNLKREDRGRVNLVQLLWVLLRPTFLSIRNSCAFVLYKQTKTD